MFFRNCISFFALSVMLCFGTSEAKVWVTHGFGGNGAAWKDEGGDFYEALKKTAAANGHTIASFAWDQPRWGYYDEEHSLGGLKLALEIIKFCNEYKFNPAYPNDAEIIVVAHSFGGKVSYWASHTLESYLLQEIQDKLAAKKLPVPAAQAKGLMGSVRNAFKRAFARYFQQPLVMPKPIISRLFTLGTPHRQPEKPASAKTVKKVYNIYSQADCVAHDLVAGSPLLTKEMQQSHPYAYNVGLLINSNGIIQGVGHSEIHNEHVAKALFDLANHVDANVEAMAKANHNHAIYCVAIPNNSAA